MKRKMFNAETGKEVGIMMFTKKGKRKYIKLMKEKGRFKPLLNDAWVQYLNDLEAIETGNIYKLLVRFNSKKQRELYTNRGPLPDIKFRPIPPYDFDGELKGIGLDVGSGKDEIKMTGVMWVYDENGNPQPKFINPDFKL